MSILGTISVEDLKARGSIKTTDVLKLRSSFYDDGLISRQEAEALFALNKACPVQDSAWPDFFVEAITDYCVNQDAPQGYLTSDNATWLIEQISNDGRVDSKTELELLVKVMAAARWVPASLAKFALEQVKLAVIDGKGPLRSGKELRPGVATEGDVEMLREVLYAFGGDGTTAISSSEAEVLFDIDAATKDADNHPSWPDFFVKAITNAVMAASGFKAPPMEEALRQENWLKEEADLSASGILDRLGKGFSGVLGAYKGQSAEERALARLERQRVEIITNEEITGGEADWLVERMNRDGELSPNEKALLGYLKKESPKIHPSLQMMIDKVMQAA